MSCMLSELVAINLGVCEVASSRGARKRGREGMSMSMSIKKPRLRRAWIATDVQYLGCYLVNFSKPPAASCLPGWPLLASVPAVCKCRYPH